MGPPYRVVSGVVLLSVSALLPAATAPSIATLKKQLNNQIQYLSYSDGRCLLSDRALGPSVTVIYADTDKKGVFHYELLEVLPLAQSNECIEMLGTEGLEGKYFYRVEGQSRDFIRGYAFELQPQQIIYNKKNLKQITGIDLLGQGQANLISECTSSEGSHFNIWQIKQKKSVKLLHRYTYLNMDLTSSCKNTDYTPGLLDQK